MLRFRVGGRERTLETGQGAVGPAGVPHAWRNLGDADVCFVVEFRPALNTETLLVAGSGIFRDWAGDKGRTPKYLLRLAVLLREAGDPHLYLAGPPVSLQRALLAAFIGAFAPSAGYSGTGSGTATRRKMRGDTLHGAWMPQGLQQPPHGPESIRS